MQLDMFRKCVKNFGVIFALFANAGMANAQDLLPDRGYVILASKHVNMVIEGVRDGRGYQEFNPGLILTWQDRYLGLDYSAGAFYNSYGHVAPLVMAAWTRKYESGVKFGVFVGAADYADDAYRIVKGSKGIVPIGGLHLEYKNLFAQWLPTEDQANGLGMTFVTGLSFALKK